MLNVDEFLSILREGVLKDLKSDFDRADEKAKRMLARPFQTRVTSNKTNSSKHNSTFPKDKSNNIPETSITHPKSSSRSFERPLKKYKTGRRNQDNNQLFKKQISKNHTYKLSNQDSRLTRNQSNFERSRSDNNSRHQNGYKTGSASVSSEKFSRSNFSHRYQRNDQTVRNYNFNEKQNRYHNASNNHQKNNYYNQTKQIDEITPRSNDSNNN